MNIIIIIITLLFFVGTFITAYFIGYRSAIRHYGILRRKDYNPDIVNIFDQIEESMKRK